MSKRLHHGLTIALLATSCSVDPESSAEGFGASGPGDDAVEVSSPDLEITGGVPGPAPGDTVITVVWHVIRAGTAVSQGNSSDANIQATIARANADFVAPSFYFQLKAIDRTTNLSWYNAPRGSAAERQMKETLRVGSSRTLNVYTNNTVEGTIGAATSPIDYFDDPDFDGVVFNHAAMIGGNGAPYSSGNQLTTWAGKWLGLEFVWHGGCVTSGSAGDFISDTPAQSTEAWGCPTGRNSCPNQQGNDPIHNFMNFTDDACRNNFTPKQYERMAEQWDDFRDG